MATLTSAPENWYASLNSPAYIFVTEIEIGNFQRYGDNRWVAQWATKVFHTALFDDQEFDVSFLHRLK